MLNLTDKNRMLSLIFYNRKLSAHILTRTI
nr:MAG TPA: hypothetical protein [Caudoviricetes sp.]